MKSALTTSILLKS